MTAREFAEQIGAFEDYNRSRNLSPKTIRIHNSNLRTFSRFCSGEIPRDAKTIRKFLAHRITVGNKPLTIRGYVGTLRAFYRFLVMDQVISEDENPMRFVKRPRVPDPDIQPLTPEETRRLLACFNKESRTGYRDYIITLLILDTGLRAGEVVRLKVQDVNLERSSLNVNGKGQKVRRAFFGQTMRGMLKDYMEGHLPKISRGNGTLFPPLGRSKRSMLTVNGLSQAMLKKMDQAGIPRANSSAHRLRHTFAVNFLRNGGNAFHLQRLLGHSTLDMTKRYVSLVDDDLAAAMAAASPLDGLDIEKGEENGRA